MRAAFGMLTTAAIVYAGFCALMFFQQRSLMYFPTPPAPVPAGAAVLALPVDGARLAVTALRQDRANALLYFGGNAEDVNGSVGELSAAFPDHAIYLMQYRGYGHSSGTPTERALVTDALALFDSVRSRHARIDVAGRSLGSGVAVQLASARPVGRLVLVTPFDSLRDVAAGHYKWLPVRWLMRDRYDSGAHAPGISVPTTLVAAEHDEIIPTAQTETLFKRFPAGVAEMVVIEGTAHNTISLNPRYIEALRGGPAALARKGD
jgi:pimeloyl-ACP methyl ester carboxylesterase